MVVTAATMNPLVEDFVAYLAHDRHRSKGTVDRYGAVLEDLVLFCEQEHGKDTFALDQLGKPALTKFLRGQTLPGQSASWNNRLAALRAFFDYLKKDGRIRDNPALLLDRHSVPERDVNPLSLDEFIRVVDAVEAGASPSPARHLSRSGTRRTRARSDSCRPRARPSRGTSREGAVQESGNFIGYFLVAYAVVIVVVVLLAVCVGCSKRSPSGTGAGAASEPWTCTASEAAVPPEFRFTLRTQDGREVRLALVLSLAPTVLGIIALESEHAHANYAAALLAIVEARQHQKDAAYYAMMAEEAGLRHEQHYEDLAGEEVMQGRSLQRLAFRRLALALPHWPHTPGYKGAPSYLDHQSHDRALGLLIDLAFQFSHHYGSIDGGEFMKMLARQRGETIDEFFDDGLDAAVLAAVRQAEARPPYDAHPNAAARETKLLHLYFALSPAGPCRAAARRLQGRGACSAETRSPMRPLRSRRCARPLRRPVGASRASHRPGRRGRHPGRRHGGWLRRTLDAPSTRPA